LVQPYNSSDDKKNEVRAMFNNIARNYDLLNHLLSLGIDVLWRKRIIRILQSYKPDNVLDIATGTADLAIMAAKVGVRSVAGIDLSEMMIEEGNNKVSACSLTKIIKLEVGDAEQLPYKDEMFDAATVAFGVRNFADLKAGLRDINRVLKSGAPFIILEFSKPVVFPVKQLYHFYSFYILPLLGRVISKDKRAYMYLPESINVFPAGDDFLEIMSECGFSGLKQIPLSFRIATIYVGHKS
jgi:demethylmenaquinone methyltransferase/2-methoxy-6-polyprenyl-1,4-benzoquinol methylase